jgi:hypothetical protein
MAESTASTERPTFKSPGSDEWRALSVDSQDEAQQKKAKDTRDSLKETLLASLQMQHAVVLAGSGTSLGPVGGPSMKDLWNAAIEDTEKKPAAMKTAKKIRFDLAKPNIEELLSNSEAYLQWNEEDVEVKNFVDSCKKVILKKCSEFLDVDKLGAHQTFLHRLSRRRVRDPRLKVFTTNYDLCFERAAGKLGIVVIDGFSFTPPRHYDPRYFGYDIVRRFHTREDQGNYLEGVFHLYKLHGSVNWSRESDYIIQQEQTAKPDKACLIYPARGKYQQSFLQPYLESVSQYLAALREPNTCIIVVGFGFNDDHLSEPLLESVRSNPSLRLVVVNPNASAEDARKQAANTYWQQLFQLAKDGEDIWFVSASFEAFADLIPDLRSLTPAEKLVKAVQGIA